MADVGGRAEGEEVRTPSARKEPRFTGTRAAADVRGRTGLGTAEEAVAWGRARSPQAGRRLLRALQLRHSNWLSATVDVRAAHR